MSLNREEAAVSPETPKSQAVAADNVWKLIGSRIADDMRDETGRN